MQPEDRIERGGVGIGHQADLLGIAGIEAANPDVKDVVRTAFELAVVVVGFVAGGGEMTEFGFSGRRTRSRR
jgi:uncharacterized membrane protein YoaK (UPF0700 family)